MQEVLVLLKQSSAKSGIAVMCLGDSHVSVTHGPDSDKPVDRHVGCNNILLERHSYDIFTVLLYLYV